MPKDPDIKASKYLSFVLRHKPQDAGLELDANGWVDVQSVLANVALLRDRAHLEHIVATNPKKRFALSDDAAKIRANQGHSVDIDLALAPATPPDVLFHGTSEQALHAIMAAGLVKRARQHVHLSTDQDTAQKVGQRHGPVVILRVDAAAMATAGLLFYKADNGVWLTDHVPSQYLQRLK